MIVLIARGEKYRGQFIAAFTDLAADGIEVDGMAELSQRLLPRKRMPVDGIQQRAIHVEDCSFKHSGLVLRIPRHFVKETANFSHSSSGRRAVASSNRFDRLPSPPCWPSSCCHS